MENEDSITEEPNKQNGNATDSSLTDAFGRETLVNSQSQKSNHNAAAIGLSLRNLNSMRRSHSSAAAAVAAGLTNGDSNQNMIGSQAPIALDSESELSTMHNQSYKRATPKNPTTAKFEAFGQFVASSLIDLPETDALELVQRFTSDLVKSLIASKTANIDADNNKIMMPDKE